MELWHALAKTTGLLYTTDYVVDETITLLRVRIGHSPAVEFGKIVLSSKVIRMMPISAERWQKAWDLFVRYQDKEFSFTDCTSFAIMSELKLRKAMAFDQHFSQMGFSTVP
jgi:predicted nucleic acid-binding protein